MTLSRERQPLFLTLITVVMIIAINLYFRPILPLDETRYTSVAWEMWQSGNWLVPHINGATYAHKPPMMFWLMNIMWLIFGVSETVARLIVPMLACANFFLIYRLAQRIYPERQLATGYAPLVLLSFAGWTLYTSASMFDLLLSVFVLGAVNSIWRYAQTGDKQFVFWAGLNIGIGMLVKGPVMLVYILPILFWYRLWCREGMIAGKTFAIGCALSLLLGIAMILSWAITAAIAGGPEYAEAIFWRQSAGRMVASFAHARPIYWYVLMLPVLLLPWALLAGVWRTNSWFRLAKEDYFCISWFFSVFVIFSAMSGKQIHYLFPVFPAVAMFISARIEPEKFTKEPLLALVLVGIAIAIFTAESWISIIFKTTVSPDINVFFGLIPLVLSVLVILPSWLSSHRLDVILIALPIGLYSLIPAFSDVLFQIYDVKPMAQVIKTKQDEGKRVAYLGSYHNTFQFLGRLEQPLQILDHADRAAWISQHPESLIIVKLRQLDDYVAKHSEYTHSYRGQYLVMIQAQYLHD